MVLSKLGIAIAIQTTSVQMCVCLNKISIYHLDTEFRNYIWGITQTTAIITIYCTYMRGLCVQNDILLYSAPGSNQGLTFLKSKLCKLTQLIPMFKSSPESPTCLP